MKSLQIQPQPRLGAARVLRFCLRGIRYRLFRSGITVAVIAVAVAFLMNILAESLVRQEALNFARSRLEVLRLADTWAGRLAPQLINLRAELVARSPSLTDAPPVVLLEQAGDDFFETVQARGFVIDQATRDGIVDQAAQQRRESEIDRVFQQPEVRRIFAAALNQLPNDLDSVMMWKALGRRDLQSGLAAMIAEKGWQPGDLDPDGLGRLAASRAERERLESVVLASAAAGETAGRLNNRTFWLIGLSLLVCGVGITNALLMTVTERYREIATLKCLGALDGTVMGLFVMEGALFGLVGGVLGASGGALLGILRVVAEFGSLALSGLRLDVFFVIWIGSAVMGVVLAAIASLLPSLKAATMPPLEAMRVE